MIDKWKLDILISLFALTEISWNAETFSIIDSYFIATTTIEKEWMVGITKSSAW